MRGEGEVWASGGGWGGDEGVGLGVVVGEDEYFHLNTHSPKSQGQRRREQERLRSGRMRRRGEGKNRVLSPTELVGLTLIATLYCTLSMCYLSSFLKPYEVGTTMKLLKNTENGCLGENFSSLPQVRNHKSPRNFQL